jgi:hypothetical protein
LLFYPVDPFCSSLQYLTHVSSPFKSLDFFLYTSQEWLNSFRSQELGCGISGAFPRSSTYPREVNTVPPLGGRQVTGSEEREATSVTKAGLPGFIVVNTKTTISGWGSDFCGQPGRPSPQLYTPCPQIPPMNLCLAEVTVSSRMPEWSFCPTGGGGLFHCIIPCS